MPINKYDDDTWVCKQCCASSVEEQVWVKINSYNRDMAEVTASNDYFFCPECNEDVEVTQYCDFGNEDE